MLVTRRILFQTPQSSSMSLGAASSSCAVPGDGRLSQYAKPRNSIALNTIEILHIEMLLRRRPILTT